MKIEFKLIYCRFGFVEFGCAEEVESAIEGMQGTELGGKELFLDHAGRKTRKISHGEHNLDLHFIKCGTVNGSCHRLGPLCRDLLSYNYT